MLLCGFTDEAGKDLAIQIEASRRLGWHYIEARNVDAKGFAELNDAEFDDFCAKIKAAGIRVCCMGSAIANWKRAPLNDDDFVQDLRDLDVLLPRMEKLGIPLLRGMSYQIDPATQFDAPEVEKVIFAKLRQMVRRCEDAGVIYAHENCRNYGGQSHVHTLRLLEAIPSPNFKLIFDTGNPVSTFRRLGTQRPYSLQDSWEFYRNVREFICHVHIKDRISETPLNDLDRPKGTCTWAGEGNAKVREIVTDLRKNGYDAGFSIEPHIAPVFHEDDDRTDDAVARQRRLETYVEYGQRFEQLLTECGWNIPPFQKENKYD